MHLHLKGSLTNKTTKKKKVGSKSNNIIKKTLITTFLISAFTFNTAFSDVTKAESNLQTIYHVYINDQFLGTISEKEPVESLLNKKFEEVKSKFEDKELTFKPDEVSFIPEQILRSTKVNNEKVYEEISKEYQVNVEAVALKVNGQTVTYLANEETVEQLIRNIKLKYISEEDLAKLEAGNFDEPLEQGESRITDIYFSNNLTMSLEKVKPEEVLSVEDAITLLEKGTLEEEKYTVQPGDVLGTIANDNGLTLKQLLELNPDIDEDTIIRDGDQLNITVYKPYIDVIVEKEVSAKEEIPFETEIVENDKMYKGDKKTVQNGKAGEKVVKYVVSETNGVQTHKEVIEETVLSEPTKEIIHKGTKVVPSRGTGQLAWPTNGGYISSYQGYRWGAFHKGIDIARPSNRTIKAADNGTVVSAGWDGGYGNKVVIDHNNGIRTVYAHLESISVSVGQTVEKGRKIGVMGSTGNSTGVHLHFEVYKNGALQNPMSYLN